MALEPRRRLKEGWKEDPVHVWWKGLGWESLCSSPDYIPGANDQQWYWILEGGWEKTLKTSPLVERIKMWGSLFPPRNKPGWAQGAEDQWWHWKLEGGLKEDPILALGVGDWNRSSTALKVSKCKTESPCTTEIRHLTSLSMNWSWQVLSSIDISDLSQFTFRGCWQVKEISQLITCIFSLFSLTFPLSFPLSFLYLYYFLIFSTFLSFLPSLLSFPPFYWGPSLAMLLGS